MREAIASTHVDTLLAAALDDGKTPAMAGNAISSLYWIVKAGYVGAILTGFGSLILFLTGAGKLTGAF